MEPAAQPSTALADRVATEFLGRYLQDRLAGRAPTLAESLARHPGFEARIAEEWAQLQQPSVTSAFAGAITVEGASTDAPPGYRLLRELGRGGQGVVYLAHDERLGREVALKLCDRGIGALDGPAQLRFQREIEAVAQLDHPSLCTIYAAGTHRGTRWIAMKFIAGLSLQQQLDQQRSRGDGPPRERAAIVAAALCIERLAVALQQAHAAGLVHRDIKPANVLIAADGVPVLVDFGLLRGPALAGAGAIATLPGAVLGTPSYMPPEQMAGATCDARSDVWSLGACLYELLTLQRPFQAATLAAELQARTSESAQPVRRGNPAVPTDLATVVATAMAHEPARRYASAAALADDLRRWRELRPVLARPASLWRVLQRWLQRNRALAVSLAALGVVLLLSLAIALWLLRDTREALADVMRLSDLKTAAELQQRAGTLFPLREVTIPRMDAWLAEADALLAHRELHERAIRRSADGSGAVVWQREQLEALLGQLTAMQQRRDRVQTDREFARLLAQRTLVEPAVLWQRVRAQVRESKHYAGLDLPPQLGLVPLGPDPDSGLQEFAHLLSGAVPTRDAAGKLVLDDGSAVVLVLIPGGEFVLGAVSAATGSDDNVDADAPVGNGPCYRQRLAPYFLGKFELTQAQWRRHTGDNPSNYSAEATIRGIPPGDRNPVENIDWKQADDFAQEHDLVLPTEAQWEAAYRAGSRTVFPHGPDERGLQGRENLADADAESDSPSVGWPFVRWLHDGHPVHAAVGKFLPNAYGLHDMGGNVCEWCADSWEDYPDAVPRDGDGLRRGEFFKYRVIRGGSYAMGVRAMRSAYRGGLPTSLRGAEVGLRPARRVEFPK